MLPLRSLSLPLSPVLVWCRALAWVAALLLPQMLGLLHSVAHSARYAAEQTQQASRLHHHAAGGEQASTGSGTATVSGLSTLFASHEPGSGDCRLYDQASHDGLATTVAALHPPLSIPSKAVALFAGQALARWAALFDARGPPLTT